MKSRPFALGLVLAIAAFGMNDAVAQSVEYVRAKPLKDAVRSKARPVPKSTQLQVPLITWGGDVATIHAVEKGFFADEGLDVSLVLENNFPKQVEAALSGRSPFLRGTMGMINAAAETFKPQRAAPDEAAGAKEVMALELSKYTSARCKW